MKISLFFNLTEDEFKKPLKNPAFDDYKRVRPEERIGPENPDGSVNWTCPCLGHGSLVAHRCGFFFRPFYVCAKKADSGDAHSLCGNEFVNWSACLKDFNDVQREAMRKVYLENVTKDKPKS